MRLKWQQQAIFENSKTDIFHIPSPNPSPPPLHLPRSPAGSHLPLFLSYHFCVKHLLMHRLAYACLFIAAILFSLQTYKYPLNSMHVSLLCCVYQANFCRFFMCQNFTSTHLLHTTYAVSWKSAAQNLELQICLLSFVSPSKFPFAWQQQKKKY